MITHEVQLRPFTVPTYVFQVVPTGRREDGPKDGPKFSLGQLSDETLIKLCDEFRISVMKQAAEERRPAGPSLETLRSVR